MVQNHFRGISLAFFGLLLSVVVKAVSHCYGKDDGYPGWILVDFSFGLKSWYNARDYCESEFGTKLAAISNPTEMSAFIDFKDDKCQMSSLWYTWIGGQFQDNSCGNLQWDDGTVDTGYRDWDSNEPNLCSSEKCIEIYSNNKWNTRGCGIFMDYLVLCNDVVTEAPTTTELSTSTTSKPSTSTTTRMPSTTKAKSTTVAPHLPTSTQTSESTSKTPITTVYGPVDTTDLELESTVLSTAILPTEMSTETTKKSIGHDDKDKKILGLSPTTFWLIVAIGSGLLVVVFCGVFWKRRSANKASAQMTDTSKDQMDTTETDAPTNSDEAMLEIAIGWQTAGGQHTGAVVASAIQAEEGNIAVGSDVTPVRERFKARRTTIGSVVGIDENEKSFDSEELYDTDEEMYVDTAEVMPKTKDWDKEVGDPMVTAGEGVTVGHSQSAECVLASSRQTVGAPMGDDKVVGEKLVDSFGELPPLIGAMERVISASQSEEDFDYDAEGVETAVQRELYETEITGQTEGE